MRRLLTGVACVLLGVSTITSAQQPIFTPFGIVPVLDAYLDALRQQAGIPGMSAAIIRDGQILWEEAFGWADRENRIAATPHTLYSLASISKPITATGLMILKERGLIDVDRPIYDYLGDAMLNVRVGDPAAATVRRDRAVGC